MLVKKQDFADDVGRIVGDVCKLAFNIHSEERFHDVFGISYSKMNEIVRKIVDALPDKMFENGLVNTLEEVKSICAREFVFFQVQERCDDIGYEKDLADFINILSRDLQLIAGIKMKEEQK